MTSDQILTFACGIITSLVGAIVMLWKRDAARSDVLDKAIAAHKDALEVMGGTIKTAIETSSLEARNDNRAAFERIEALSNRLVTAQERAIASLDARQRNGPALGGAGP